MTDAQRSNRKLLILFIIALIVALIPWVVLAQELPRKEKFFFDKGVEEGIGYTQALKVGNTIYISGVAGRGPMDQAVSKVYGRLETVLKNYGVSFGQVVKETLFTTQMDEMIKYREVRNKYYKGDFPVSSWVEIKRLYVPDAVLEVELIAIVE